MNNISAKSKRQIDLTGTKGDYLIVSPEPNDLKLLVLIWPTLKSMRQYLMHHFPRQGMSSVLACVVWPARFNDHRIGQIYGEMHLNQTHLKHSIITHEIAHAALLWMRCKRLHLSNTSTEGNADALEERFCDVVGAISSQIFYGLSQMNSEVKWP